MAGCLLKLYVIGGVGGVSHGVFRWEMEGVGWLGGGCLAAAVVGGGGGVFMWRFGGLLRPSNLGVGETHGGIQSSAQVHCKPRWVVRVSWTGDSVQR